jgi:hypothetical protein
VRSTSIPAYLPPPAYPRRTLADEASEDDDELPMSTAPDSPPPAALSAVTVRRQASRERKLNPCTSTILKEVLACTLEFGCQGLPSQGITVQ